MNHTTAQGTRPARIESLKVRNFRALKEVQVLWRNEEGFTQTKCVADIDGIDEFVQEGASIRTLVAARSPHPRIIVVVDRDEDDCEILKGKLEDTVVGSGLESRTRARGASWQVVNRIAIEELEAWYFGDWEAVRSACPRVAKNISNKANYRQPDAIRGGTWQTFERILKTGGYFKTGLPKVEAARAIAEHIGPSRNRSRSFQKLHEVLAEATA